MTEILFHIDERKFDAGDVDRPYVLVRKDRIPGSTVTVDGNRKGLETYIAELRRLDITKAQGNWNNLWPLIDDPVISKNLNDLSIASLTDEELDQLQRLPDLTSLSTTGPAPKRPIAETAPNLRFLVVGKLSPKSLVGLDLLEGLRLISGAGHIESCNSANIKKLFVTSAEPSLLDKVASWPALETLSLVSRKKDWSFNPLARFPALQNFAFEGPAEQDWLSLPATLQKVSIEKVMDSVEVGRHLSNSSVVSIGFNPKVKDDDGYYAGDLLEGGDPFRSLECDVFYKDIT